MSSVLYDETVMRTVMTQRTQATDRPLATIVLSVTDTTFAAVGSQDLYSREHRSVSPAVMMANREVPLLQHVQVTLCINRSGKKCLCKKAT